MRADARSLVRHRFQDSVVSLRSGARETVLREIVLRELGALVSLRLMEKESARSAQSARRLHCSSTHPRLNAGRMLPKGAKTALPAVRGKQTRMSVTGQLRTSDEVKSQHKAKRGVQAKPSGKTCSEFATRLGEAETRISRLEDDVVSQRTLGDTMEKKREDAQWKLTDLEDKRRRNNLRVLGIPEGAKGLDLRGFVVALFKEAFPDLNQWEWEREIQRAHQVPFISTAKSSVAGDIKPRAMLISLLNFQARRAVYDLAHPDRKRTARGCDFFVRPDFCHTTVEKRWKLSANFAPAEQRVAGLLDESSQIKGDSCRQNPVLYV
ncbi:hypothetical protein NDU88_000761 [Pleurodeles waltl]|uniref:Transposase n=1 Tax=Pleurodeles waltl TaxID=8319 RepID=A0AAV7TFV7_PLEWA|nr:hypothetical protein NDU88_000761 [Pleurodeles waltl]